MSKNNTDIHSIISVCDNLKDALAKTVKISYGQILYLVIDDLVGKYKSNLERGDSEWAAAFLKVLRYYLTGEEINQLVSSLTQSCHESRQYTCCDGEERCPAYSISGQRCMLPKGHQGKHLTTDDVEF